MKIRRMGASAVLFVLVSASAMWGQLTTATIVGGVRDQTEAVLPGVAISVRNVDTGVVRQTTTNARGYYVVPNLNPGNYEVEASLAGFQTAKRSGFALTVGSERSVDFTLTVGAMAERIEVTGELPIIETTSSTVSGLVDERTIRDMPLDGRSYERLALLQVGVGQFGFMRDAPDRGRGTQFSVAGSRPIQNAFLLDGMDITEFGGATPGSVAGVNLGVEALREFQVLTNTFPAEFGRSPGGIINAVTNSGTNTLHGSVYHFLRNSALDAKNFFDRPDPEPIPPFKRNQFGFTLGGPIRKDKAFFFGNYEGLRSRTGLTQQAIVPSLRARSGILSDGPVRIADAVKPYLAIFPEPNVPGDLQHGDAGIFHRTPTEPLREDYGMMRVDVQLSNQHSLFGRYIIDDSFRSRPGISTGDAALGFSYDQASRRNHSVVGLDTIFSPTVLNVFRMGFNRHADRTDSVPIVEIDPKLSFVPGKPLGTISVTGFAPLGSGTFAERIFITNLFEYVDTLHFTKGSHAFKVGADVKRIQNNVVLGTNTWGGFTFATLRGFLQGGAADLFRGVKVDGYPRGFRQNTLGFFAQDDYRLTPNLTLNLGIRWEFTTTPTEVNGKLANFVHIYTDTDVTEGVGIIPKKKNIAPRFGLAWSPTSSGKTSIRAGFGIYHEIIMPVAYANYLGNVKPNLELVVRGAGFPDPLAGGRVQADPPAGRVPEVNMHTPSKIQYNLNVQHEVLTGISLMVGYLGSQSRHLGLAYEANDRAPTVSSDGTRFYPLNAPFRNPALGAVTWFPRCCNSSYNGMVIELKRQPRGMLGFQLAYTFSKSTDVSSNVAGTETQNNGQLVMDPFDFSRDHARSAFDISHSFVANYSLSLPSTNLGGLGGAIVNGWGLQGILTAATGLPTNIQLGFNGSRSARTLTGGAGRPDLAPGANNNPVLGDPFLWFDPTVFRIPEAGFFGNLGRNTVTLPGTFNFDFSLTKDFAFRERYNLKFRSEFFNSFNHPRFGLPGVSIFTPAGTFLPAAGRILATNGQSRQIQFSLKLTF